MLKFLLMKSQIEITNILLKTGGKDTLVINGKELSRVVFSCFVEGRTCKLDV